MKKVILLTAIICSLLSACTNTSNTNSKSHEHEDGSTHGDHTETLADTVKQEEFNADSTSSDTAIKATPHEHKSGESHTH